MSAEQTEFIFETRLEREFRKFHDENPIVWKLFEEYSLLAFNRGRTRFGGQTIWERMRWYRDFETTDAVFKLNNNHVAYYARLFMERHPECGEFFSVRTVEGER